MIRYCSNNMSCTPPDMYRDRFVNYMAKVIVKSSSFKSAKNPLMEKFKISNYENNNNNNSNNILIQNNTSNYYNIINNNNNIMVNSLDENPINQINSNSLNLKKDKIMFTLKYGTKEVIKEESEQGGMSVVSSKIGSGINKDGINSSF